MEEKYIDFTYDIDHKLEMVSITITLYIEESFTIKDLIMDLSQHPEIFHYDIADIKFVVKQEIE